MSDSTVNGAQQALAYNDKKIKKSQEIQRQTTTCFKAY